MLQQTGEQRLLVTAELQLLNTAVTVAMLLVTAELQLLNTAVTVAVCAEAQTSVCW